MQVYTFCSICGGDVDPPTPHLVRLHQEPLLLLPDNCQGGQQDSFISNLHLYSTSTPRMGTYWLQCLHYGVCYMADRCAPTCQPVPT